MSQSEVITPKWQMLAQISICDGCCCGKKEKGHPEVPVQWLKQEWKVRGLLKRVHLSVSGCLGPCDMPNVVMITNSEGTQWLARLYSRRHFAMLADWAWSLPVVLSSVAEKGAEVAEAESTPST